MCGVNLLKSWRMGGDLESTNGVREIPVMHYVKHPSKRQLCVFSHAWFASHCKHYKGVLLMPLFLALLN